ncbi:MAG: tetratricopeptide repeat protein [Rhizobiales bacterium]|nr:tetratricopeptide repeat protein [Hyphomicrobiales bacterium]
MSDESLFREVDEEVRQDQFKKLWARYGNLFVALCLAVVAVVAGIKGWQYWQTRQAEQAAEAYGKVLAEIEAGRTAEAVPLAESIGHQGYALLARMAEAAALGKAGKTAEAIKMYDAIAADRAVGSAMKDAARVRAAYLLVDTLSPSELAARLSGLDADNSAWRNAVHEILAISAYRTGDYALADRHANEIVADITAAPSLRQRAQMIVQLVTPLLGSKPVQQTQQ